MAPEENKRLPGKPVRPAQVRPVKTEETAKSEKAKPKISRFTKALIIWLILLTVVIAGGLVWFNGFLGKYEEIYQSSLPYHQADKAIEMFAKQDLDGIWGLVKNKPSHTEFETEATIKKYIKDLISNKEFTYQQTEDYAENAPEYYIISEKVILAKLKLAENEEQKLPYGFKNWKIGDLEFYSAANNKFKITLPEGYKLTVNGVDVPVAYRTQQGIEPEENKYLKPYAELPKMCVYEAEGLFAEPEIKVTNTDGKEVKAEKDKTTGEYKVNIRSECSEKDRKAIDKFGISFTKDFANYISQDAGNYALDKYFPKNSKALRDIKRNSSREWYTRHGKVDLKNEEVKDFICYTKDIVYVEVYVEQHMEMFWGSKEREVVKTTAHLYLARIDGNWKVAGIRY
ncbi:MAG: hypothetical protein K5869_08340 [Saccharofermentans sp.]|nr:hypothetical protein [Saccharofermentans sp.]